MYILRKWFNFIGKDEYIIVGIVTPLSETRKTRENFMAFLFEFPDEF